MANIIKETNRTIEISAIESNYGMDQKINVQSVVFIPGAINDVVDIIEINEEANYPIKVQLLCGDGEPRGWIFNQRLQLGFIFATGTFSAGSKVIFNIGELKGR